MKSNSFFKNAITTYLMAKPKQRSNPSLENNYNTASDNNIYKCCKHFYSILLTGFREEELLSKEYFGFWLALSVLPSSRFTQDYWIREGFMLGTRKKRASLCIKIFFSEAMTKTFQHLKQWQPTSIVSALSLESVRIVNRYKVHKRPKMAVVFETSFFLAKANGYPTFHGWRFSMGTFL